MDEDQIPTTQHALSWSCLSSFGLDQSLLWTKALKEGFVIEIILNNLKTMTTLHNLSPQASTNCVVRARVYSFLKLFDYMGEGDNFVILLFIYICFIPLPV